MESEPNVSVIFPSKGSVMRRPLPSTGSRWIRFPRFLGTMERSDFLSPISSRFVSFTIGYHRPSGLFAPHTRADGSGVGLGLFLRAPQPLFSGGDGRISQVPGKPQCLHALLSDPGGTSTPVHWALRCSLPLIRQRRLPHKLQSFEAPSHGLHAPCVRFAVRITLLTTQHSVPADGQSLPDRLGYLLGFSERFHGSIIPPLPGFAWHNIL